MKDQVDGLSVDGELKFNPEGFTSLRFGAAGTARSRAAPDTIKNDERRVLRYYCNLSYVHVQSLGAQVVSSFALQLHARRRRKTTRTGSSASTSRPTSPPYAALDGQPILDENGNPTGNVVPPWSRRIQSGPVLQHRRGHAHRYRQRRFRDRQNGLQNAGLRSINTETTARTAVDTIVRVDDPTPDVPTSAPDVTYSPARP